MMEESSDESTEIITKEEAEMARRMQEVNEGGLSHNDGGVSWTSTVSPPAPLPSFITSDTSSPVTMLSAAQAPVVPLSTMMSGSITPPQRAITPSSSCSSSVTSSLGSTGQRSQSSSHQSSRENTPSCEAPVTEVVPCPGPQISAPQLIFPGHVQTPHEASSPSGEEGSLPQIPPQEGGGLLGWISSSRLVNKVVKKTKSSVETMITTLDPGMKEIIKTGGDISVVVTSTKQSKLGAVREAFQVVFGKAVVRGMDSQATTAAQPVGFTAGLKGAEERIQNLKHSGSINVNQTVVSVEGFIAEMFPDRWYEMSCILLVDPVHRVELQTFSQPTPVPAEYILKAQDRTTSSYPLRWSGLAVSIGQVVEESHPHIGHADWQNALAGVSRRESLFVATKSLAYMYQQRLPTSFIS